MKLDGSSSRKAVKSCLVLAGAQGSILPYFLDQRGLFTGSFLVLTDPIQDVWRNTGKRLISEPQANLFWQDFIGYSPRPGVPIRLQSVLDLGDHHFRDPSPFPAAIVVAVGKSEGPMVTIGRLRRVSPEEMPFALLR